MLQNELGDSDTENWPVWGGDLVVDLMPRCCLMAK